MAVNLIDVADYTPSPNDTFFFDNNIWMFLFCPLGNYKQKPQQKYSSFLEKVKSANSMIFTTSMILSEFSNTYLRLDYELWKDDMGFHGAKFKKDYVGTDRYKETVGDIKPSLNQILKLAQHYPDDFNAIDIDKVLTHFRFIDFNDSYYIELCESNKWVIVTDDKDFIKYNNHSLDVITYKA